MVKRRLSEIMEHGSVGDRTSQLVGRFIVLLIMVNLVAVTLESVPELAERYRPAFDTLEVISLAVFSVEYALRILVAGEHPARRHLSTRSARWRYITSAAGLIDLVAVLPFWFSFAIPADLRVLLVLRIVRLLKLARYSPGVRSLLDALYAERRALGGCLVIFGGATLISATAMHMAERHVQPEKFGTIPEAMWWAIVTLGTIGYGDLVPVTPLGRLIAAATIFAGLIMVALPVGITATAFSEEIHRRDFVVTWGMVARVPLFVGLNAGQIAEIMRLMRAQTVGPGAVVARRGELIETTLELWTEVEMLRLRGTIWASVNQRAAAEDSYQEARGVGRRQSQNPGSCELPSIWPASGAIKASAPKPVMSRARLQLVHRRV